MFLSRVDSSEPWGASAPVRNAHPVHGPKARPRSFKGAAARLLLVLSCAGPAGCLAVDPAQDGTVLRSTESVANLGAERSNQDQASLDGPQLASSAEVIPQGTAPPLGILEPPTGLLPSGTASVTLALTTTAPADCRWSEQPDTPYAAMPYDFQQGQGMTVHTVVVAGLHDLDDRRFYVRCQDLDTGRDPDSYERQTHVRVLGPWDGGYPRMMNLYGEYGSEFGPEFYAGYDVYVPYSWPDPATQAPAIRAINPGAKILRHQNATYGWPDLDPLATEWWNSLPGNPGFICLLRDSNQRILLHKDSGPPMYNLTQASCRQAVVQENLEEFLSSEPDLGANLAYDGIYWDLLHGYISWLGDDIDSDLDGQPDDPDILNAAYRAGVEDLLTQVRARLSHIVLAANEAPQYYAPWINGRLYEWQLPDILNGAAQPDWDAVIADYRQWAGSGQPPHATVIFSAPEAIYREKHDGESEPHILPAFQEEAAASYQRMRFGLTTALMGAGLFFYDLREVEGPAVWYDEFGAPGTGQPTSLPPRGYLGQPSGDAFLLVDELDSPDQILNGDFEDGLTDWSFWVNTTAGAAATADIDPQAGVSGSAALHAAVSSATGLGDVLLSQYDKTMVAGQSYTLSFWARSEVTQTLAVRIGDGFRVETSVTPVWQHFHLWDDATVTSSDGELAFGLGASTGELWLDDVQLKAGALGVWARSFENGLVVINSTREAQTAPLPGGYCKLRGSQAPLFQARLDDDQAQASVGWSEHEASDSQFGSTVHTAPGASGATVTYAPVLAHSGTYEVLAWVAPAATQSSGVLVTIRHAQGETVVLLDQTTGEVGWHSLGRYTFKAGEQGQAVIAATGSGIVVADAFKWVSAARYNDGTRTSEVDLQPLDGIVLLSSCYEPDWQGYLPLVLRD